MLLTCGLSQYSVALFHLVNHAFFKALLFLSAGAIIHALNDEQRLNKMGGLVQLLPFTYSMMLIGSMSLIALPFLTGFYSKDLIIELAGSTYIFHGSIAFFFSTFTALLTAFYSSRLLFLTFFGQPNGQKKIYESIHEPPFIMSLPLIILALFSIFFGYIFRDLYIGLGTSFWGNSLFIHPNHSLLVETEFGLPIFIKLLPMFGTFFGIISAYFLYLYFPKNIFDVHFSLNKFSRSFYRFLSNKWYFDRISTEILDKSLYFGFISFKTLDKGIIELIGPSGITHTLFSVSKKVTSLDTGYLPHYLLYIVISFIFLIFFILFELDSKLILLFIWIVFFLGPIHRHNSPLLLFLF
jgi:NADH-ubiquinone oxidoreductase chain 5